MRKIIFTVLAVLFALSPEARPLIGDTGSVLNEKKNEIKIDYEYLQAKGRYSDGGNYTDLLTGEAFEISTINLNFNYGAAKGSEIDLYVPYITKTYTRTNGDRLSAAALGDITLLGKNGVSASKSSEGYFAAVAGVKFPSAKSMFNVAKGSLPTGTGTWDIMGGFFSQEKRAPFILYGDFMYIYRFSLKTSSFAGYAISEINGSETEVNLSPGVQLKYDVCVEYPLNQMLSLLVEFNGFTQYETSANYAGSNGNAAPDLNLKDPSEYSLMKSISGKVAVGAVFGPTNSISLGAGASLPVISYNWYGGMTFYVNVSVVL